jgi:hypothetical protein
MIKKHLVPRAAPLEERIKGMLREVDDFILERAKELHSDGVPLQQVLLLLRAGKCPCQTAFAICETRRRDSAIATREAAKEHAKRSTNAVA